MYFLIQSNKMKTLALFLFIISNIMFYIGVINLLILTFKQKK